jgi:hypothetical protein
MTLPAASEKDALLKLLASWSADAKARRDAHRNAGNRLRRWHYLLGVPALVLSALVAMLVFATLQRVLPVEVTMVVGAVSVCAAVLTACQTFLRCSDRAEQHRQVSAEYEGIANRAELLCAMYQSTPADDARLMNSLRDACTAAQEQMASLATRRPEVSERDQAPRREALAPAIERPIERSVPAPIPAAAFASVLPTGGLEAAPSIPAPARLPTPTLPPVRAPQPHGSVRPPPSMPPEPSAASVSSSMPPAVERRERRTSQRPPPLPSTDDEGTAPRGSREIAAQEFSSSRVRGS